MNRQCVQCYEYYSKAAFSKTQWSKPISTSRCTNCVQQQQQQHQCPQCHRKLHTSNELRMHLQTHRIQNLPCPGCAALFKSGVNIVQHIENGFCPACKDVQHGREQVLAFLCEQKNIKRYLLQVPETFHEYGIIDTLTKVLLFCPECCKLFRLPSQLLQHLDTKHNGKIESQK